MRLFGATCSVGNGEGEIRGKTIGEVTRNLCIVKGAEFRNSLHAQGSN